MSSADALGKISEGVESFSALTPTLPPATHTESYALGVREIVLVEPATPYEDERQKFVSWAEGLRSQGRNLIAIFATHHHPDHVGGAAFFKEALGLPLWAHEATAVRLRNVEVDRRLGEGDAIDLDGPTPQRWKAMHTPGHAPGHLCLFEESIGALVVGDMVASTGTILIEPKDGDMIQYLASLRRLEALNAKVALPAHGAPIAEPSKLFRGYVAHRLMREGAVLRAVESTGGGTLDELLPIAYVDTNPALFPIARMSLEAHLDKLVREGAVVRRDARYEAPAPA